MILKISINDEVKVKLTDFGIQILKERHDQLNKKIKESGGKGIEFVLRIDKDGYYKTQLYNLMNTFGEYMTVGSEGLPFEIEIEIEGGN